MPKDEKTIDIDTSGPGVDIELPEEKNKEKELENEATQDSAKSDDTSKESDKQPDVQDSKLEEKVEEKKETEDEKKVEEKQEAETKVEEKKELEEYSEGVQRRISKLTKKWREAERQKEAALDYAKGVQYEHSQLKTKFSKLEPNYVKALENRVTAGMDAAKAKLTTAREAGDINAEAVRRATADALEGLDEAAHQLPKGFLSRTTSLLPGCSPSLPSRTCCSSWTWCARRVGASRTLPRCSMPSCTGVLVACTRT